MTSWKTVFNLIAAGAAFISAVLWFGAAKIRILVWDDAQSASGVSDAQIVVDDIDFFATVAEQAKWNRWTATRGRLSRPVPSLGAYPSYLTISPNEGAEAAVGSRIVYSTTYNTRDGIKGYEKAVYPDWGTDREYIADVIKFRPAEWANFRTRKGPFFRNLVDSAKC